MSDRNKQYRFNNLEDLKKELGRPNLKLGAIVINEDTKRVRYCLAGYADERGQETVS